MRLKENSWDNQLLQHLPTVNLSILSSFFLAAWCDYPEFGGYWTLGHCSKDPLGSELDPQGYVSMACEEGNYSNTQGRSLNCEVRAMMAAGEEANSGSDRGRSTNKLSC
jgi:hypothetical protein